MLSKKEIFSIPNILCYIRILLVPVFLYTFFILDHPHAHMISAGVLILSSLSDFLDGFIARKFDMITELGKLIDPIADKLTQIVVALTLAYTYPSFWTLVAIIIVKDSMLLIGGLVVYKKKHKHLAQAEFPGKIATAVFFVVSILLIAFYIPGSPLAEIMIYATLLLMFIAMIYYAKGLIALYQDNETV